MLRLRTCSQRIRRTDQHGTACALADLGRCGAPCAGRESAEDYAVHAIAYADLVAGRSTVVLDALVQRLERLAAAGRYEDAARHRDRTAALVAALRRRQRLGALAAVTELVAAAPDGSGGWWLVVIRSGRLVASGHAPCGVDPMPVVDLLQRSAETVRPGPGPLPASSAEEVGTLLSWLEAPGARLVRMDGDWYCPIAGAGRPNRLDEAGVRG